MPIQNSFDEQYLETLKFILNDGELKGDRTGTGTKTVFGAHINHRMSEGFPILTTKKVAFGLVASELEFFIKGLTSKAWLQERNNHIWDEWCSPTKVPYGHDAETKAKMKAEDDLGPIYGYQLRNFGGTGYDQLKKIVDTLKTNPTDRRMVASYWAPHQLKDAALPPCHYTWGVNVVNNKLNLMFVMRSVDWPLGAPFDLAHYGLLLHLLAKEAGLEEGQLVGNFMDTHVYMNQIEKVSEQLTRTGYELPKIVTENWTSIYDWKYTDSKLINYQSDAAIKMIVAV